MVIFILTLYHYTTTLSVVVVLESVYEFSDMKKSYELLEGKRPLYLFFCIRPYVIMGLLVGCFGDWVYVDDKFGVFVRIVRKGKPKIW